ncbi:MAG TPA: kelch repeat-containing protein, partial [Verrucomicrobiae bacterium]|nr:kelch repeat-containing protein [Verrucomicrobiae bacterium]
MKRSIVSQVPFLFVLAAGLAGGLHAQVNRWAVSADMQTARAEACSTLLADGRLLVAGGIGAAGALNTAEMYGADGTFHSAGHMQTARVAAACVTLEDGRVLVSGGTDSAGKALTSAEIFDPSNNSWRNAGGMRNARSGHQMALTSWGSVIVAGGERSGSVEIYIPGEGSFQSIGRLSSVRLKGAIAALPGRRVAFLGGSNGAGVSTTIDIYDANSNTLKPGGTMLQGRSEFAAATLVDGRVWISGGRDSTGNTLSSTEIFDPAQGASTAGPDLPESRAGHSAYLLPHNNGVLLVGGRGESGPAASTLLYTSWNGNLTALPPMETARHQMTASPVGLGALVAAGGRNDGGILAGSELFRFPTIQPDRTLIQPGDTINFLGTGWKPGDRVALQVMALPADDRGVLFTGSGIVDRSGRLSTGGFTVPRGHSGGLQ